VRRLTPGGLQSSYQEDVFERTQGHFKHSPCDYRKFKEPFSYFHVGFKTKATVVSFIHPGSTCL